jgi:hypothetical protein
MSRLGSREWVGLGLLVAAVVVALSFLTYNDSPEPQPPTPSATGSALAKAEPTPTQLEQKTLPPPVGWVVSFLKGDPATATAELGVFSEFLEVEEKSPPFPDYRDGNFGVIAEVTVNTDAGAYAFSLELQGKARLLANGNVIAEWTSPDKKTKVSGRIPHQGGALVLRIEATDPVGFPLIMRWK